MYLKPFFLGCLSVFYEHSTSILISSLGYLAEFLKHLNLISEVGVSPLLLHSLPLLLIATLSRCFPLFHHAQPSLGVETTWMMRTLFKILALLLCFSEACPNDGFLFFSLLFLDFWIFALFSLFWG